VDAMKRAGPALQAYSPSRAPVMNLIRQLTARRDLSYVCVEKSGFRLELKGRPAGAALES
jgi:hypothetical protein